MSMDLINGLVKPRSVNELSSPTISKIVEAYSSKSQQLVDQFRDHIN